jgi:spermidine/putrescine transport system substrate-binding protein
VPKEGTHRYIDNLAVLSDAPNKAVAEKFINYCLYEHSSRLISERWPYTNPNGEARKLLTPEQLNNPASYPTLPKAEAFRDIGKQAEEIDRMMTELRSGG